MSDTCLGQIPKIRLPGAEHRIFGIYFNGLQCFILIFEVHISGVHVWFDFLLKLVTNELLSAGSLNIASTLRSLINTTF